MILIINIIIISSIDYTALQRQLALSALFEPSFLGVVSVAQLVKTPDVAVLGAVAALVRACMAWVRPQAKALFFRGLFFHYG